MAAPISILPAGTAFTRTVMMLAKHPGQLMDAITEAEHRYRNTPQVAHGLRLTAHLEPAEMKAAVSAGTTAAATWAAPLAQAGVLADFIPLRYSGSVIGRLKAAARAIPFNVKVPRVTAWPTVYWVGEAKAKAHVCRCA